MSLRIRPYHRFTVQQRSGFDDAGSFLKLPPPYFSGFWLLLALLVSNGSAYAEWILVSGGATTGLTVYVDPDTIRREGNLVKMSSLIDYKTRQIIEGGSLLSIQRQNEYDCAEERTRMLASTWFSGNMKSGQMIHSDSDEDEWEPIAPGSTAQGLLKVACGKE